MTFQQLQGYQVGECPEKRIICSEFGEISRVIYIEKNDDTHTNCCIYRHICLYTRIDIYICVYIYLYMISIHVLFVILYTPWKIKWLDPTNHPFKKRRKTISYLPKPPGNYVQKP